MKILRLLLFALPLVNLAQSSDNPLTNQTAIQLVQNGVRSCEIVRIIKEAPTVIFDLSPTGNAQLSGAGVSDDIFKLMAAKQSGESYPKGPTDNICTEPYHMGRQALIVREDTLVRLRLNRSLSSADSMEGESVHFYVLDDVVTGGRLVIERGAAAFGTITLAEQRRRLGRGGKLGITIDFVKLADGGKLALWPVRHDRTGGGHVGAMVGAMVATTLVGLPGAPFFLLLNGKNTRELEGQEYDAFTDGDANLDGLNFAVR